MLMLSSMIKLFDKPNEALYNWQTTGVWCSGLTRCPVKAETASSNLVIPANVHKCTPTHSRIMMDQINYWIGFVIEIHAQVAQLVEHRTENPGVAGSSPALSTRFKLPILSMY